MTTSASPTSLAGAALAAPQPHTPSTAARSARSSSEREHTLRSLSIVLTCRNAESTVAEAVRNAAAAADAASQEYEIIVVDDGSSDATVAIAGEIVQGGHHIRLLVHSGARGYGDALRSGIRAARHDWVLLAKGDLEYDVRELEDVVGLTRCADVVWGWPVLRQGPVRRRARAAARSSLIRAVLHVPLRDVDCPFKLIRREFLEGLDFGGPTALVDAKVARHCRELGARIVEVGVHHHQSPVRSAAPLAAPQ